MGIALYVVSGAGVSLFIRLLQYLLLSLLRACPAATCKSHVALDRAAPLPSVGRADDGVVVVVELHVLPAAGDGAPPQPPRRLQGVERLVGGDRVLVVGVVDGEAPDLEVARGGHPPPEGLAVPPQVTLEAGGGGGLLLLLLGLLLGAVQVQRLAALHDVVVVEDVLLRLAPAEAVEEPHGPHLGERGLLGGHVLDARVAVAVGVRRGTGAVRDVLVLVETQLAEHSAVVAPDGVAEGLVAHRVHPAATAAAARGGAGRRGVGADGGLAAGLQPEGVARHRRAVVRMRGGGDGGDVVLIVVGGARAASRGVAALPASA